MFKPHLILFFSIILAWHSWGHAKSLNEYLAEAQLDAGIADFSAQQQNKPHNEIIFSLATLHFFAAIEQLAQDFYAVGLKSRPAQQMNIPFLRLPIATNPKPKAVSAGDVYVILDRFYTSLEKANQLLQTMDETTFIVPIDIARIRLDLNGNQQLEEDEYFHQLYTFYNRQARRLLKDEPSFIIHFDTADAYWLKGYTHLLMALLDMFLAYDGQPVFEYAGHLFFAQAKTQATQGLAQSHMQYKRWADAIALIHVIRLDVYDEKRLNKAHEHLRNVIDSSRRSWQWINQETDNENEWIPNVNQVSVTGVRFTTEMITGWHTFLDEFEQLLMGEKLLPHWRFADDRGINLHKVFFQPQRFDPVLWVHGSGVIPFLETGERTTSNTWNQLNRLFQGNFIGFAIWIN